MSDHGRILCADIARHTKSGSALMIALWVLLILSLLIGGFAFDMHIEAGITSFYRKRMKAQRLAHAGVEWAKLVLVKSYDVNEEEELEEGEDEQVYTSALNLSKSVSVSGQSITLGSGKVEVEIKPEQGRHNVNSIDEEQWVEILDRANIPVDQRDELIDCFVDWVDENDIHQLNGAESDDPFYEERGYEVKNGPLDSVDELLLIKGFSEEIVYGGPSEDEDEEPYLGIAQSLTVWGDGKINVNTASREVLMTLIGMDEVLVDDLIDARRGLDGEEGTRDDGFDSVDELLGQVPLDSSIRDRITTTERRYVRVVSIGEVDGVRTGVWCILLSDEEEILPVFWREELLQ